jgi:hypothetical protein
VHTQAETVNRASEDGDSPIQVSRPFPVLAVTVGALVSIVVLVLRYAGVLVGPAAAVVAALCVIFFPGPRRLSERLLLLFALIFGWLPLLGWVPGLGTSLDVPGVVLAIAVGVTCAHQVQLRAHRGRGVSTVPTASDLVALAIGGAVAMWWALPYAKLTLSGRLGYLLTGWDNNSHFGIFEANLRLGSFIQVRPNLPGGGYRLGYDYPQGMHQAWAQLVRLWNPHPSFAVPWLLNAYSSILLVTFGGTVILLCMAVSRLSGRDLPVALPGMAIVVALFGTGRFIPFAGYVNYELAIAACAVCISLMVRPTLSPLLNFFAVAGMGLIIAYNWYPLLALAVPAVVVAAIKARSAFVGSQRRLVTVVVFVTAIAFVMPAVTFSHRGVSALDWFGVWSPPPWGLLILSIATLAAIAIYRQNAHSDWATNIIVGWAAIAGGGAILVVSVYETRTASVVAYYGQKLATAVFAVALIVLVCVLVSDVANSGARRRLSMPVAIIASLLISAAALQIDGYVGPFPGALQSATNAVGIYTHDMLRTAPPRSADAQNLIDAAEMSANEPGQWWYIDPTEGSSQFGKFAQWFDDLRGEPSNYVYFHIDSNLAPGLNNAQSSEDARAVIKEFPNPEDGQIHLFVPIWLESAMVRQDPAWEQPGALHPLNFSLAGR